MKTKKPKYVTPCHACGELTAVVIDPDGFFESQCKGCKSHRTWRVLGKKLPMTFEMLPPTQLELFDSV